MSKPGIRIVPSGPHPAAVAEETRQVLFGASAGDGSPVTVGRSAVPPGTRGALIQHETDEIAYVLRGSGAMGTDTDEHPFVEGDAIFIERGCWHAINTEADSVTMLYVFPSPALPPTRTRAEH